MHRTDTEVFLQNKTYNTSAKYHKAKETFICDTNYFAVTVNSMFKRFKILLLWILNSFGTITLYIILADF